MCKTKMAVNASEPNPVPSRPIQSPRTRSTRSSTHSPRTSSKLQPPSSSSTSSYSAYNSAPSTSTSGGGYYTTSSSSTLSSRTSLSSLRENISQNPNIYDISEIRSATNNFLAKRYSATSTTPCWRCKLRNTDTIIFQRKFRRKMEPTKLKECLSLICRSHHTSVVKLLGVSISDDHIYLVYEYITGANLSSCLRNSRNPNYTVLSSWQSRMQVAADLAHGLDYIHNKTGLNITLVHSYIKSSAVIVTEPEFRIKICHFGSVQLCGDTVEEKNGADRKVIKEGEITEVKKVLERSNSGDKQFEGVRGYMSPEFQESGIGSQKADVYAFGVVILELLSGEEPLKFRYDKSKDEFVRTAVIETAKEAVGGGVEGRLRSWIDRRLKDSYPVDVAGKLTRLALECVHVDPDQRPDMGRVAGKISKLYLASQDWFEKFRSVSDQITVSWAPR